MKAYTKRMSIQVKSIRNQNSAENFQLNSDKQNLKTNKQACGISTYEKDKIKDSQEKPVVVENVENSIKALKEMMKVDKEFSHCKYFF